MTLNKKRETKRHAKWPENVEQKEKARRKHYAHARPGGRTRLQSSRLTIIVTIVILLQHTHSAHRWFQTYKRTNEREREKTTQKSFTKQNKTGKTAYIHAHTHLMKNKKKMSQIKKIIRNLERMQNEIRKFGNETYFQKKT